MRCAWKYAERQRLQVREEVVAHVVLDVARRTDEDPPLRKRNSAAGRRDDEQQRAVERRASPRHAAVEVVDGVLQDPRREELDRGRDEDAEEAEHEGATVTEHERQEPTERRAHPVQYRRDTDIDTDPGSGIRDPALGTGRSGLKAGRWDVGERFAERGRSWKGKREAVPGKPEAGSGKREAGSGQRAVEPGTGESSPGGWVTAVVNGSNPGYVACNSATAALSTALPCRTSGEVTAVVSRSIAVRKIGATLLSFGSPEGLRARNRGNLSSRHLARRTAAAMEQARCRALCYPFAAFPSRLRGPPPGLCYNRLGARESMRISAAVPVFCLAVGLLAAPAAAQSDTSSASNRATGENYHVEIGGFLWSPSPDVSITSESLGIVGSTIDYVTDLGIERSTFKQLKVVLRPSKQFKFRLSTRRSTTAPPPR